MAALPSSPKGTKASAVLIRTAEVPYFKSWGERWDLAPPGLYHITDSRYRSYRKILAPSGRPPAASHGVAFSPARKLPFIKGSAAPFKSTRITL
jgi:hypothetical protein